MLGRLLDVLDRDEADAAIVVVDDDAAFRCGSGAAASWLPPGRRDRFTVTSLSCRHQLGDRLVEIGRKAHVAVGQDAEQLAALSRPPERR